MSEKARDNHGRWRSKTIAFRMSPEENQLLDDMVRLSGLTKQEYIIQRVLDSEVVIQGNPRVHRALKKKMEELCEVVSKLANAKSISPETVEVLKMLAKIYSDMKADI